jgi:predicted O-methyltransferase YrrM
VILDERVTEVLDTLHRAATRDWRQIPKVLPYYLYSKVTGRSFMKLVTPAMLRHMYIPVSRRDGGVIYALARGFGARRVVEFGASFGISTLYLGAAVRANGGGTVITTEIEPSKCRAVEDNVRRAGLDDVVDVREGDALHTLRDVDGPIDLVFLDGWKDLYLPVLELLRPRLRPGAMVLADNVNMADTRPYLAHVRGGHGFESATLPGGRMEATFFLPA